MTDSVEAKTYNNYINGKWSASVSGKVDASRNPADTRDIVGHVQQSALEDVDDAVAAAKQAGLLWRRLSGAARGDYLFKAAAVMEQRLADIAETMTREMGKTLAEAKGETARGVAILRYYAGEGMRKVGDVIPSTDSGALMYTTRVPLGVVGIIAPWNFPVAIPVWKMAPALVYGNTVVLKPAQETAVTAAKIFECFAEAGFPAGVANMVSGSGSVIGSALVEHPEVKGISFTGSNGVGKRIGETAFSRGAKFQLEMGGKNPLIVADDADLEQAAEAAIAGGLRSTGQKCTATSRIIVQSGIYEAFKARLLSKIAELTIGNGLDTATWMGPCASEGQMNTVLESIRKGLEEGAVLLSGGSRLMAGGLEQGYFVQPAVFEGVTRTMLLSREEIFGPVLALMKAETMEEALEMANDSEFGLSASIFTKDIGNILAFTTDMEAGLIRINSETAGVELQAPFGGMKQSSSHSREQGQAAIEFFTSIKTVFIKA